jgi:hypothetical protein
MKHTETVKTNPVEQSLKPDQRQAIAARWAEAIEEAALYESLDVPRDLMNVTLSHPDSVDGTKRVRLSRVRLRIPLNKDDLDALEDGIPPLIEIYVEHTGTKILNDAAFEEGVSKAITAIINKPVKVRLYEDQFGREGDAIMEADIDESSWNLADYILKEYGFDGGSNESATGGN